MAAQDPDNKQAEKRDKAIKAAARASEPAYARRFYTDVAVVPCGTGGFAVALDGRVVKTPSKQTLSVAVDALAEAIADEWRAQEALIKPETMPMTRLSNTALDAVAGKETDVAADIVSFAGSDLVCYRADHPAGLVAKQRETWDPLIEWMQSEFSVGLNTTVGIMPVEQPGDALRTCQTVIEQYGAMELSALHVMTTLTGSCVIALAHVHGQLDAERAWSGAHVDEDWQISQWGEDRDAAERRAKRWTEFSAASRFFTLLS